MDDWDVKAWPRQFRAQGPDEAEIELMFGEGGHGIGERVEVDLNEEDLGPIIDGSKWGEPILCTDVRVTDKGLELDVVSESAGVAVSNGTTWVTTGNVSQPAVASTRPGPSTGEPEQPAWSPEPKDPDRDLWLKVQTVGIVSFTVFCMYVFAGLMVSAFLKGAQ